MTPPDKESSQVVMLHYPNPREEIAGEKIANRPARLGLNLGLSLFLFLAGVVALWPGTERADEVALIVATVMGWLGMAVSAAAFILGCLGAYLGGKPNVEGDKAGATGAALGMVGLILLGAYLANLNEIKSRNGMNKTLFVRPRISMAEYEPGWNVFPGSSVSAKL